MPKAAAEADHGRALQGRAKRPSSASVEGPRGLPHHAERRSHVRIRGTEPGGQPLGL